MNQNDCQELLCFCSFVFDSEGEVGVQQQVLYNFADSRTVTHCIVATQAIGVQGEEILPGPTVADER